MKREKSGSKPHEHGNRHERDQFRLSKIPLVDLSMALAFTPPHSPTSAPVVRHLSQALDVQKRVLVEIDSFQQKAPVLSLPASATQSMHSAAADGALRATPAC